MTRRGRKSTPSAPRRAIVAYSESFYVVKKGSWIYTYSPKGKRLYTFSASNVGDVLSATGNTFTSRKGNWIYTWDKNGKKINTRSANH